MWIFTKKFFRIFRVFRAGSGNFFIHNLLTYFDKALWLMTILKISVFLLDIKPCQVQNTTSQQTIGGLKVMATVLMLIGLPFLGLIALFLLGELVHEIDKYNR